MPLERVVVVPVLEPAVRVERPARERWYMVTASWPRPDGGMDVAVSLGRFAGEEEASREVLAKVGRADEPDRLQVEGVGVYADRMLRVMVDWAGGEFADIPPEPLDWDALRRWQGQMCDEFLSGREPLTVGECLGLTRFVPLAR